jgi:hypothetical protein
MPFLFLVCCCANEPEGGEAYNSDMFVTANTAEEARSLWEQFQRVAKRDAVDRDATQEEIDEYCNEWIEQHPIDYVFLVPPVSKVPGVHLWREFTPEGEIPSDAPAAVDCTESDGKELEIACKGIEIQREYIANATVTPRSKA